MKAILGIDGESSYVAALSLVHRLQFPDLKLDAVHVVETPMQVAPFPADHPYAGVFAHRQAEGERILREAAQAIEALGLEARPVLLHGTAPTQLIQAAERENADLIAVGSKRMGRWGSLFFGSVTRALAIESPRSFLVGKNEAVAEGPVTAVLAVDHSPYCDKCMDRFVDLAPGGLRKVTIVTAHWTDISMLDMALKDSHLQAEDLYAWVEDRVRSRSAAIAERLGAKGIETDVRILQAEPREAIAAAMEETKADLLVMGARGHGLKERLVLGSVAMHEVVVAPHSVLVIRV